MSLYYTKAKEFASEWQKHRNSGKTLEEISKQYINPVTKLPYTPKTISTHTDAPLQRAYLTEPYAADAHCAISSLKYNEPSDFLSAEDINNIHEALERDCQDSIPITPKGVRSWSLLESAVNRPLTGFGSERKYSTIELAAAALFHSLVMNHPFYNGNKRAALMAFLIFLYNHSYSLTCSHDELFEMTLKLAQHNLVSTDSTNVADGEVWKLAEWVKKSKKQNELPFQYPIDIDDFIKPYHSVLQRLAAC